MLDFKKNVHNIHILVIQIKKIKILCPFLKNRIIKLLFIIIIKEKKDKYLA